MSLTPASATAASECSADINVSITPEVPAVVASSSQRMYANVSICASDSESIDKTRVGVDLVMILDKSGSMGGEKESLLRNAVEFVIGELDDRDRLCSVAFDTRASYVHGLIGMNSNGRSIALSHARGPGLRAGGGTDIYDGLQKGVAALDNRKMSNSVTTIFLLTDGIDNRNLEEKLALARRARSMGWFMFIFAFGKDHNAAHLRQIAEAADSSYVFIDNLATVREAFGGAIGSQQGVAGKLLNVSIEALDPGVQIHRALAGQYSANVAADGRMAVVSYPNLLVGERRDCCIELTIPTVISEVDSSNLLRATLVYTPADAENTFTTSRDITVRCEPCTVSRPEIIDKPLERDVTVDAQINRLSGIDTIERATSLANDNKLEEARELISNTKKKLQSSVSATAAYTSAMTTELDECMGRLQSQNEWNTIGMAEQMESLNINKCQRGVYSKKSRYVDNVESVSSAYATNFSKSCQKKASWF